ncbi:hypothetical protein [Desulfoscipio geothermicus]|uniref:Fumarate reductase flavoprotein C-term n=1 Tax=Desulfoscipio geothermicus DSM 3669 TaxID=1121426 RepID=A0A1I6CNK1_9FIRM|nr:hypothetical protein [Desulfoscipio geothermicus]SFQ94752.1 Fumarate reductase flavoprotein C-term [Desulfoscipio geothermicus DSM 3669]
MQIARIKTGVLVIGGGLAGLAAVLSEGEGGDSVDRHVADTLAGGAHLNDARLVGILAGGVHGANRLAGNALTEAAVFGLLAGREAAAEVQAGTDRDDLPDNYIKEVLMKSKVLSGFSGGAVAGKDANGRPSFSDIAGNLRGIMGRYAGLVRTAKGLKEARDRLGELTAQLEDCSINSYQELLCYHQTMLMLTTAGQIIDAALNRQVSVGAHYRVD